MYRYVPMNRIHGGVTTIMTILSFQRPFIDNAT